MAGIGPLMSRPLSVSAATASGGTQLGKGATFYSCFCGETFKNWPAYHAHEQRHEMADAAQGHAVGGAGAALAGASASGDDDTPPSRTLDGLPKLGEVAMGMPLRAIRHELKMNQIPMGEQPPPPAEEAGPAVADIKPSLSPEDLAMPEGADTRAPSATPSTTPSPDASSLSPPEPPLLPPTFSRGPASVAISAAHAPNGAAGGAAAVPGVGAHGYGAGLVASEPHAGPAHGTAHLGGHAQGGVPGLGRLPQGHPATDASSVFAVASLAGSAVPAYAGHSGAPPLTPIHAAGGGFAQHASAAAPVSAGFSPASDGGLQFPGGAPPSLGGGFASAPAGVAAGAVGANGNGHAASHVGVDGSGSGSGLVGVPMMSASQMLPGQGRAMPTEAGIAVMANRAAFVAHSAAVPQAQPVVERDWPLTYFDARPTAEVADGTGMNRRYPCPFPGCSRVMTRASHVEKHMRVHTNERPHQCPTCDMAFKTNWTLTKHMRTHTGEKPFQCEHPGCGKTFTQRGTFNRHVRLHAPDRSLFQCHCGKTFKQQSNLTAHQLIHTAHRFECPQCDRVYKSKRSLEKHQLTHVGDSDIERLYCRWCSKRFFIMKAADRVQFEEHEQSHMARSAHPSVSPEPLPGAAAAAAVGALGAAAAAGASAAHGLNGGGASAFHGGVNAALS